MLYALLIPFHSLLIYVQYFNIINSPHLWQIVESPHGNNLFGYLKGGVPLTMAYKVLSHSLEDRLRAAPHLQTVLHDGADQLRIALPHPP